MNYAKSILLILVVFIFFDTWSQVEKGRTDDPKISNQMSMRSYLEKLEGLTGYKYIFGGNLVDSLTVNLEYSNEWREEFEKVMNENGIGFREFENKSIVLFKLKKKRESKVQSKVEFKSRLREYEAVKTFLKPIAISNEEIVYPAEAISRKLEGSVGIKLLVTKKGNVKEVAVDSTSGYNILDSAAVSYARRMKFIPAESNGKPRDVWLTMVFKFLLAEDSQL